MRNLCTLLLAVAAVLIPASAHHWHAVGWSHGFAAGTIGGGHGTPVYPRTIWELRHYLCSSFDSNGFCTDNEYRNIILDRGFDFRGYMGSATEWGCFVTVCSGESEFARNIGNFCNGRTGTWVTYDKAGANPLIVGSNKSIVGVGQSGIIIGTGLRIIGGAHNIIIQNVMFQDINYNVVFGGDAITIDGGSYVWIDHNYFQRIGRQMIVTGSGNAKHVTISNNVFDGRNPASAFCDGRHYWLWLFQGVDDTITVSGNYVHNTSGRGPGAGGGSSYVRVHMVNNFFQDLGAHGAVTATGSAQVLMEGNWFRNVPHPIFENGNVGSVFAPFEGFSAAAAWNCNGFIGRTCVSNNQVNSGTTWRPTDELVIRNFQSYRNWVTSTPYAAIHVPNIVPHTSGTGIVN